MVCSNSALLKAAPIAHRHAGRRFRIPTVLIDEGLALVEEYQHGDANAVLFISEILSHKVMPEKPIPIESRNTTFDDHYLCLRNARGL